MRNKVNRCGIDKIWIWWFNGVVKSTCVRCPIRSVVSQERVEPLLKGAWYKVNKVITSDIILEKGDNTIFQCKS